MKNIILYPLVSTLSLAVSGVGTYLVKMLTRPTSHVESTSESVTPLPIEEETNFSKMINNMMNAKEVISDEVSITVSSTYFTTDLVFTINCLDMDISSLVSGGDVSSLKLKCDLNVKYNKIDENISINLEGDDIYLGYENTYFAFSAPETLSGITPLLNELGIDIPSFDDSSFDMSELTNNALAMLEDVKETQTTYGYDFTLDLSPLLQGESLPFDISNTYVILSADKELNLTGVSTYNDGIKLNSSYAFKVSTTTLKVNNSSSYQALSEEDKGKYSLMTSSTTTLSTSIAKLLNKKNFNADYNIELVNTKDNSTHNASGYIKGDLSSIKEDVKKGTYEFSLEHEYMGSIKNQATAIYKNNNIYLEVNNLIKGRISNQTIEDLIGIVSDETSLDANSIEDEINTIVNKVDLGALKQGDLSQIKGFVNNVELTSTSIAITLDASYFDFGDYLLTLVLSVNNEIENGFSLEIKNLVYKDFKLNVSLDVSSLDKVDLKYSDEELNAFKDYKGVATIFNSISDLVEKKKFTTTYSMAVLDTSENKTTTIDGEISADMTSFSKESDPYYGDYKLSLNTNLNGYSHDFDIRYLNHDVYLKFDKFFQQKISDTEIGEIYKIIDNNTDADSDTFKDISDTLEYLKSDSFINHLFSCVINDYSLVGLEDYLTIDKNNNDPNKLIVELNLPKVLEETYLKDKLSSITLEVDTDENKLTSLSLKGLSYSSYTLDFTLNLEDVYNDFSLTDDEKSLYTEMDELSKVVNGMYALPTSKTQFSVNLQGGVFKENKTDEGVSEKYALGLVGDVQVDLSTKTTNGDNIPDVGGVLDLYQPKDNNTSTISSYDFSNDNNTIHEIKFAYKDSLREFDEDKGYSTSGQTIAEYTSIDSTISSSDSNSMHLLMKNSDIFSIYDRVTSINGDSDNLLYKYLHSYFDTASKVSTGLPLMDAFKNKDYTMLLNDYIKKVEFHDKEMVLEFAPSLLDDDYDYESKKDYLTIKFDDNYEIQSADIEGYYSSYHLKASISLGSYDTSKKPTLMEYNDTNKSNFVDVHGFDTLINCFITTTEHHFFDLSGDLSVGVNALSIANITLSTYFTAYISVEDEDVNAYLSFNNGNKSISDNGFYGTEFFVTNENMYTIRTTNSSKKGTNGATSEIRKLTKDELIGDTKRAVYYILDYILNISSAQAKVGFIPITVTVGGMIMNSIYKSIDDSSSSETTLTSNYSSLITQAIESDTDTGGQFQLSLDLGKLINISMIDFKSTEVDVDYTTNYELSSLNLSMSASLASIADLTVSFTANRTSIVDINSSNFRKNEETIKNTKMSRFTTVKTLLDVNYFTLPEYNIVSITASSSSTGSPTIEDNNTDSNNPTVISLSYSEANKYYFFGIQ